MGRLPKASGRQRPAAHPPIALVPKPLPAPIPEPPKGLLPLTRERWETFWRSDVAQIARASGDVDLPGLHRWILNLDEWTRAVRAMRRKRIVLGSMGQPTLNPLAAYIASREAAIREAEAAYGMTPMARLKLGIAVGQARLTAQQLNKDLDATDSDDDAELGAEWTEA